MSDTPTKRLARKRPPAKPPVDPPTANGADDDEDDESTPAPMKSAASKIRGGWTESQKQHESTSSYAKSFRPEEKTQVIKFLQDAPYASYRRHWVDGVNDGGQKTTRAYVCPLSFDDPCPLCEVGDKAQAVTSFNVALCGDDGQVLLRSWDMGVRIRNVVKSYSQDPKIAPITRNFFLASKTGTGTSTQYNLVPVRATSLEEDYDIPVPDQAEVDRLELYGPDIITVEPIKKLRELAGNSPPTTTDGGGT